MSSEELVNIATNVDTYLRYLATPGQTRFVAPSRRLEGAPYPLEADLIVHVDGVPTNIPWTYDANSSEIVLSNGLMSGALVEIWRRTEVDNSLVEFPVAQKWLPKDNNKSMTQLLMCIQELWGGIKELNSKLNGINEDLQSYVNSAIASVLQSSAIASVLQSYVNRAIASFFEFSGLAAAVWSTTLSAGDTSLVTPYSFTMGILIVGDSVYNLANPFHVTLDNTGANTVINFLSPLVVDNEAILIIFD